MGKGIDSARRATPWESVPSTEVLNTLSLSLTTSKALSAASKRKLTAQIGPALESLSGKGASAQAQTFATVQGLLANVELSRSVNAWLQGMVSGAPTIYDRAMDATYNATHIGGGLHRMFDGGHTIPGAFEAARNASPDDNIFQEAAGLLQALARDATTPMGLPLVNWDRDTFYGLANTLEGFGIPRDWLVDLVNYDAVELVGSSIGVVAIALNWNNEDIEEFTTISWRHGPVRRRQRQPTVADSDGRSPCQGVPHRAQDRRLEGVHRRSRQGRNMHRCGAARDEYGRVVPQ